jgi:pimeloyl-ACP methyl ester carboxylesterase
MTPSIGLRDHVRDVLATLDFEDITDAILVAHSYAGMLVPAIAAGAANRLARTVIVDGFLPARGEVAVDLLPPTAAAHYRDSVVETDNGPGIPPRPLANLGVRDATVLRTVPSRLTPQPLHTYLDAASHGADAMAVPGHYLLCDGWATPFELFHTRAAQIGWMVERLPADHEVMLTEPGLLSRHLLLMAEAATEAGPTTPAVSGIREATG